MANKPHWRFKRIRDMAVIFLSPASTTAKQFLMRSWRSTDQPIYRRGKFQKRLNRIGMHNLSYFTLNGKFFYRSKDEPLPPKEHRTTRQVACRNSIFLVDVNFTDLSLDA